MKKQEIIYLCRDLNDVYDCGLCAYEYTDTCSLKLEKIKKRIKKSSVGKEKENGKTNCITSRDK
ncbi:MAG: hypothetical protein QW042_03695 [Thermoplasmata archaeon]